MAITHRASTKYHEYIKEGEHWFRIMYQLLPAPLENYEIIISPQHCQYLDRIAEPVKGETDEGQT